MAAGLQEGGFAFPGKARKEEASHRVAQRLVPMSDLGLELWLLVHSFNKYLFSTHYVSGPILGPKRRTMGKRDKSPCPQGAHILVGETDNKQGK